MPSSLRDALVGRRYHAALAALVAGLLLSSGPSALVVAAAAAVAGAGALGGTPRLAILAAGLVVLGGGLGTLRTASIERPARALAPGRSLAVRADLLERPRSSSFGSSVVARISEGEARGARILVRLRGRGSIAGQVGERLTVEGTLRRPRGGTRPGGFDHAAYLRRRGILLEVVARGVVHTGLRRGGVEGAADAVRRRAEQALASSLPPPHAALLRGMVLGQDEAIAPLVRDDFRRSGLAHLLAVSGQNVMLLCALALPLLGVLRLGPRARGVALLALIAVYVPVAGAGPSLQRAGVMGAAGIVAMLASRPASRWYALLLAAALTLIVNPLAAGDPGWQLSFAAVAGIVTLGPGLRGLLGNLPRPAAEAIAMTVAASLATAPLVAHHFGTVSLASLPANVVALPVVAPIMWIGMAQAAVGQLAALGETGAAVAGGLARLLGALADPLLGFLAGVARTFGDARGAVGELPLESPAKVLAAYAGLAAMVLSGRMAMRRAEPVLRSLRGALATMPRAVLAGAVGVVVVTGAATVAWLARPPGTPAALTVSFLDVGQGDATLIQHPDGAAILFDGGPEQAGVARLLRAAGVTRLSLLVATHASADHHGGLRDVIERMPVDLLLDGGDGTRDRDFNAMLEAAHRRGVRRVPAAAGQVLRAGAVAVRVLAPGPRPPGPAPDDPNPRAVVAVVSAGGFDLLLSADAESPSLVSLPLPEVEAMKVPHHGSDDPGLPAVLLRLRPQVAAIEVGEGNPFGHPRRSTLEALEAAVPHVRRTDRDGTIRLRVSDGRMALEGGR